LAPSDIDPVLVLLSLWFGFGIIIHAFLYSLFLTKLRLLFIHHTVTSDDTSIASVDARESDDLDFELADEDSQTAPFFNEST
jgi:hypothetical protein